jgi:glycosyltransferase involved in cell wall biosynthesis
VSGTAVEVLRRAADIPADLYHFHDPELLWYAGAFQRRVGRPVVYDAHEDYRLQVYRKIWIPSWLRGLASLAIGGLEDRVVPRLGGVVAATPSIERRFASHPHCVLVQNLPVIDELSVANCLPLAKRPPRVAYLGGISRDRGACQMAEAMTLLPKGLGARLTLIGDYRPPGLEHELRDIAGPEHLELLGWCNRETVAAVLAQARVGLITALPVQCHVESQPTKLFEYMSAGLPVVASDIPLWRKFVEGIGCGLCVDPREPQTIADAIRWLLEHPEEAEAMGQRGRTAVVERLHWQAEFQVLLRLYDTLADHVAPGRAPSRPRTRRNGERPRASAHPAEVRASFSRKRGAA